MNHYNGKIPELPPIGFSTRLLNSNPFTYFETHNIRDFMFILHYINKYNFL